MAGDEIGNKMIENELKFLFLGNKSHFSTNKKKERGKMTKWPESMNKLGVNLGEMCVCLCHGFEKK